MELKKMMVLWLLGFAIVCQAQKPGDKAPLFEAETMDGKTVKLENLKGKVVILDFWASWCVPCRAALPAMADLYNKNKDSTLEVLAVNIDTDSKKAQKFLSSLKMEIPFTVVLDPKSKIPPKYDLQGMPTTVIIDRSGIIRLKKSGFEKSHIDEYEKKLKKLLAEVPETKPGKTKR